MKNLSKKEIDAVDKLYSALCASPDALDIELKVLSNENAPQIKQDLVTGVDKFYSLYSKDVDEKTVRNLLEQNMKGMTKVKQYSYLSNILVALTHVCGNIIEGDKWSSALDEHRVILKAVDMGLMDEDSSEIQAGIDSMLGLISGNLEACSVLLIGEPPYEKLFSACLTEDPATIQSLAANTRSSAVNMAAALYILQERGELASLGDTKIPPQDMGVMAASLLEIDAAHKSGSWDVAKKIVEKVSKTAMILLVTSPDLLKDAVFLAFVGLLTNFSTIWMLIGGAILAINIRIRHNVVTPHMEPIFKVGAKIMETGLDMVRKISHKFSEWIQTTVLFKAVPMWKKCSHFAVNEILIPAAAFLIKAKDEVLRRADIAFDKVEAAFNRMKEEVTDRVGHAATPNDIHYAASEEADEEDIVDVEEEPERYEDESESEEFELDETSDEGEIILE